MNAQLNQQPSSEFKREHRYYVLKLSDIHGTVGLADLLYLDKIARTVADRRAQDGKEQREYLVIESDWPEFEPTWQAIEARVSGVPQQLPQLEVAGWRPKFPERPTSLPPSSFNAGMPDQATVDYWKAQGIEIEYCYTRPSLARTEPETAVRVCPVKDAVCGDRPASWCDTCPKRNAARTEAPADPRIRIDFKQATELLEMFNGLPAEIVLQTGDGHSGRGLYAWWDADPSAGAMYLGQTNEEAEPEARAPQQATPTEQERNDAIRDVVRVADTVEEAARYGVNAGIRLACTAQQATPASSPEPIKHQLGEWYEAKDRDDLEAFFRSRLPAIREAAREHGYAIGLHGSLRRDLDLIAVPWREGASDKDVLAHAIAMAACGITRDGPYQWEQKPLGRVAASLSCCWPRWFNEAGAGHIDLSVVDPNRVTQDVPDEWVLMPRDLNEYEAISAQGTLLDMAWCETTCFVERYKALIRYTEPRRAALAAQAKGANHASR